MRLYSKNSFFLLLIVSCLNCMAAVEDKDYSPYPQPDSGYVTDHANLLSKDEEERIERWLWQVEYQSKVEIIVITIDSIKDYPGSANTSIETFATDLFNTYGIGNMPKNDGVMLLVARGDRKARIELGAAYGRMRDADANRIMQEEIIPHFKDGDYVDGITAGTEAIILEFANMQVRFPWKIVWLSVAAFVSLLIGMSLLRNGKRGWGYVFIGLAIVLILLAIVAMTRLARQIPADDSDNWSSGGIGGFGGGSSGGGGATGSW